MNTSPAIALLVGYLVLGAMGGGRDTATATTIGATAPTLAARSTKLDTIDQAQLSSSVSAFLTQLRPMASKATADFVQSLRGDAVAKTVDRRVPISAAQVKEAAALPNPRPAVQHVHLKVPPPAPPKTEAEFAKVMDERAMYERLKLMHEEEDLAAAH